jgi:hypothetical protein
MLNSDPPTLSLVEGCPAGYSSANQYCQPTEAGLLDPLFAREPLSQNTLSNLAICTVRLDAVVERKFTLITECAPNFGLAPVPMYSPTFKVSDSLAEALGGEKANASAPGTGKGEDKTKTTATTTTQKQKQQGA